jgi:hypothetical protein
MEGCSGRYLDNEPVILGFLAEEHSVRKKTHFQEEKSRIIQSALLEEENLIEI